jgi:hypothetical protein
MSNEYTDELRVIFKDKYRIRMIDAIIREFEIINFESKKLKDYVLFIGSGFKLLTYITFRNYDNIVHDELIDESKNKLIECANMMNAIPLYIIKKASNGDFEITNYTNNKTDCIISVSKWISHEDWTKYYKCNCYECAEIKEMMPNVFVNLIKILV